MAEYKRLGFVSQKAAQATSYATSIYTTARGYVPKVAEAYVQQAEDAGLAIAVPYLTLAQDAAEKVLSTADAKVDSLFSYGLDLHSKNLSTFNGAKQEAYGYVEGSVNQVKAYLDPTPYIQLIGDKAATYVNPDKILDTSFEVAGKVATFGPVPKVLETADPLIKTSVKTYGEVHDTVVSLPVYKKLWETLGAFVWSTGSSLQKVWVVQKAIEVGHPVLAPVTDPVYSNITNSKYLKQLQSHLQPIKSV